MIVEFVGPSGCGKSAVASALLHVHAHMHAGRASLKSARPSPRRSWTGSALSTVALLPGVVHRAVHEPELVGRLRSVRYEKLLSILALAARYARQRKRSVIVVHDQGVVQALGYLTRDWSDADQAAAIAAIYRIIGRNSIPDVIVQLDVPRSTIAGRTKMSGPRHSNEGQIARTEASINAHVEYLTRFYGIKRIRAPNIGAVGACATEIGQALTRQGV